MAAQQSRDNNEVKHAYDEMWSVFDERTAEEFAAHLVPHLKPHHRILDIGCGRGSITIGLAGLVPDGSVLGIDVQPALIDVATTHARQRNISNLEFKVTDANILESFPSESFDVIHAHQVLFYLPDPIRACRELFRILKTGGILSLRDSVSLHYYPHLPMMQKYIAAATDPMRLQSEEGVLFGMWNHVAVQEAGFAVDKIEKSSWAWSWKDPQRFAPAAKNSGRAMLFAKGLMNEAEFNQAEREWEEWALLPQARMHGLDGAVLCWK